MMAAAAAAAGVDVIVGPFKLDGVCARLWPPGKGAPARDTHTCKQATPIVGGTNQLQRLKKTSIAVGSMHTIDCVSFFVILFLSAKMFVVRVRCTHTT